ncbi:MAG: hypothetical protein WBF17_11445 [Phycisphaerae bacterium]
MRPHRRVIAWGTWLLLTAGVSLTGLLLPKRRMPVAGGTAADALGDVRPAAFGALRRAGDEHHRSGPSAGKPDRENQPQDPNASGLRISGIMGGPKVDVAIINGRPVSKGQTVNGAKVVRVGRREVEMEKDGRRFTVGMQCPAGSARGPGGR